MARRTTYSSCNPASVEPIIRLWLLRILVPLGGYREFVNQHRFNNDTLAEVIGLGHWINSETRDFDQKTVLSELRWVWLPLCLCVIGWKLVQHCPRPDTPLQ